MKPTFDQFNKTHGTAKYNRNIDYSKTFMHNPVIVKVKEEAEIDAHEKARILQEEIEARRARRQEKEEEQEIKSYERGTEALRRVSAEKMAEELKREASEELLKYNHSKIEMGKRDQGVGIRPLTKAQREANKQLRDEQDFEEMFFAGKNSQSIA